MTRRWQPPAIVVDAALVAGAESPLIEDLARALPVGATTLQAIVASRSSGPIWAWATNILTKVDAAESAHITEVLVSSGFDAMGCSPLAIGVLDPDYDGERIVAVVRAAGVDFERITASGWEQCQAPDGMPYIDLRGDLLADALETIAAGATLLLHPTQPAAWLSIKSEPQIVAAATAVATPPNEADPNAVVYAVVDPLNTSAVLSLFEVSPGPTIAVRKGHAWVPDDGTLQGQLTGLNPPPVVAVAPQQVADVLRQVDDFDATHPQSATQHPIGGQAPQATHAGQPAASPMTAGVIHSEPPSVAGLCVQAKDTGRVFMLQRGLMDGDPAQGMHEFPGGHLEDGDANPLAGARREWREETGHPLPAAINDPESQSWRSTNGVYQGFVHEIANEAAINLADRKTGTNPDDPGGDSYEAASWWDPTHLAGNPAVRDELKHTMPMVHLALDGPLDPSELDAQEPIAAASFQGYLHIPEHVSTEITWTPSTFETDLLAAMQEPITDFANGGWLPSPITSSLNHMRRVREAKTSDVTWDADRSATDLAEQQKRRDFETLISSRYATLKGEGLDEHTSASTVRREIEAENARRELWERQRADALLSEKERRLRQHPDMMLSHELVTRMEQVRNAALGAAQATQEHAIAADAVPRTRIPPALFKYWVSGEGAIKIRWNTAGDWSRCRDHLLKYVKSDYQTKALCAELHKFATGRWTGSRANKIAEGGKA